jgi:hypothetical protein
MTPEDLAELERLRAAIPDDAGLYMSGKWHAYQDAVSAFNGALCRHGADLLSAARRASVLEERNGKLEEHLADIAMAWRWFNERAPMMLEEMRQREPTLTMALDRALAPSTKGEG